MQSKSSIASSSRRKTLSHSEIEDFLKDLTVSDENRPASNAAPLRHKSDEIAKELGKDTPFVTEAGKRPTVTTMEETIRAMCRVRA